MSKLKLESIARSAARHPWRTMGGWLLVLAAALVLNATLLGDALTATGNFTDEPESLQAAALVEEMRGPDQVSELVIVRSEELTVDDAAFVDHVEGLAGEITALGTDVVQSAITFTQVSDPSLVSADRHATLIPVVLAGDVDQALANVHLLIEKARGADGEGGYQVLMAGGASIGEDFMKIAQQDAITGESVGVGVALLILVAVFGALIAAAVPVLLAGISVVVALGLTALVGQKWDLAFTVTNVITMMGLAVGIDYSLFVLSRFKEERGKGLEKFEAVARAQATAGRAVLFSGMTVIVAMSGLFIMPSTVFRSLAIGSVLVVAVAIVASMTLLPAFLGLLGDRINALQPARLVRRLLGRRAHSHDGVGDTGLGLGACERHGFWDRVTHVVMARPVVSLALAVIPLLVAGSFYFQLNPGTSGASTLPESAPTKAAFDMLERDFSFGQMAPVEVVIDGDPTEPATAAAIEELQRSVAVDATFAGPGQLEISEDGDLAVLDLALMLDPNSQRAEDAVRGLRSEYVAAAFAGTHVDVLVGGETALNVDFFATVNTYTPWVFAFVLGLSFVLLMMVFRSLVVPIKAILMNLLSVGAAYGLLVLVFQKGVGADLLGFQQTPRIEAWLPIFLFSILFGLSMDYHVLLLSRIRERYDETGNNTESVAFGLRSTAGLITGAAVIMVAVFGGFAAGDLVMFQQMGFGLAVAVLLDATIVRSVLVPATMKLLGSANWWLPRPLKWLPDLRVEAQEPRLEPAYVREQRR
ncbi:MAG TPA: MMPL family transporter [Thermoleophilia bacterium]|nr:MMPL family transporter [Thermoleophilia bacterium]